MKFDFKKKGEPPKICYFERATEVIYKAKCQNKADIYYDSLLFFKGRKSSVNVSIVCQRMATSHLIKNDRNQHIKVEKKYE